jgi:hypothetical protein
MVSLGHVASLIDDRRLAEPIAGAAERLTHSRWARSPLFYPFGDLVWVIGTAGV